jgi:hypothetical protein
MHPDRRRESARLVRWEKKANNYLGKLLLSFPWTTGHIGSGSGIASKLSKTKLVIEQATGDALPAFYTSVYVSVVSISLAPRGLENRSL